MEIRDPYNKFFENGVLKDEYQIVEKKGLTHALDFPTVLKNEWIRIVLNRIHDGHLWLEDGPINISKRIIHKVTGYPTLEWPKKLRSDSKEAIGKNTGAKWNKRGMTIDIIKDHLVDFSITVIYHKFYQSSRLNSVPCIVVDVGYNIVKKDHRYDLLEL